MEDGRVHVTGVALGFQLAADECSKYLAVLEIYFRIDSDRQTPGPSSIQFVQHSSLQAPRFYKYPHFLLSLARILRNAAPLWSRLAKARAPRAKFLTARASTSMSITSLQNQHHPHVHHTSSIINVSSSLHDHHQQDHQDRYPLALEL